MKTNLKATSHLIAFLLIAVITTLSLGCKTAGFKKPDLSDLAFWKKSDNGTALPPPPAPHFDPSPLGGGETSIASTDPSDFNRSAEPMRGEIDSLRNEIAKAKDRLASNASDAMEGATQPIRKPYSLDGASTYKQPESSFEAGKLNDFAASVNDGMSQAQQDFKTAMGGAVEKTKNEFAAKSNDMTQGWKDFKLPTELSKKIEQAKSSPDQAFDINKSLYDANGQLNGAIASNKKALSNEISKATNSFASSTDEIRNQFNTQALESTVEKASNSVNSFQTKLPNVKQIASSTIDGLKDSANGFAKQASNAVTQTLDSGSNGFGASLPNLKIEKPQLNSPDSSQLLAEVAAAKQQIEMLKQQVAAAQTQANANLQTQVQSGLQNTMLAPNNQSLVPSKPQNPPVSQLQTPKFQPNSIASTFDPAKVPSNVLRRNTLPAPQTPTTQPLSPQNQTPTTQPTGTPGSYQSTPHGGYAPRTTAVEGNLIPNFTPAARAEAFQASFESQSNHSMVSPATGIESPRLQAKPKTEQVLTARADGGMFEKPVDTPTQKLAAPDSLPASIFQSRGSYAPGSVYRVDK